MAGTPEDVEGLRQALADARAEAAAARALASSTEAVIAALKLEILKLRRELYGQRSERRARLLAQMELQLEELEATASEDELAAEQAAARTSTAVRALERRRPRRKPFPEHLPRERVVIEAPPTCVCCGSGRIAKLGEDITETLEVIPRQWKVIQTVREKFTCRDCERITQPPAPFHPTSRGWAGPNLLAMVLFEKFGQHQPLNRQAERYAREGVELSLSTLADQVGACTVALAPLHALIEAHVLAAERLHGDDTPVPVLARGKTDKGRLWVMSATTARSPAAHRLRPCSSSPAIAVARTRSGTSNGGTACSRPTHMRASARSMLAIARRDRSPKRCAGRTGGASSSSSPRLRRMPGAARMPSRSRRWGWRR
jgi:transposase